ncbi:alginate export family protein [Chlamydiota bacterium]
MSKHVFYKSTVVSVSCVLILFTAIPFNYAQEEKHILDTLEAIKHPFSRYTDLELGLWNFFLARWHKNHLRDFILENYEKEQREIYRNYTYLYAHWRATDFFSSSLILRNIRYFRDYYGVKNENKGIDVYELYATLKQTNFSAKLGRQYLKIGKGFLLRDIADAGLLSYEDDFVTLSFAKGEVVDPPFDPYFEEPDNEKDFYYAGATLKNVYQQKATLYWARLMDESPEDLEYDAYYLGVIATGELVEQLSYYFEYITGWGTSSVYNPPEDNPSAREDIDAWLCNFSLSYALLTRFNPVITGEVVFASGDSDAGSVINPKRGNVYGTEDKNFRGIDGFVIYGLALDPDMSNIQIYRIGASFDCSQNISSEINYYYYRKAKKHGIISDPTAYLPHNHIGDEIDLSVLYSINEYLSCEFNFAYFMPGDAYKEGTKNEQLFEIILTFIW